MPADETRQGRVGREHRNPRVVDWQRGRAGAALHPGGDHPLPPPWGEDHPLAPPGGRPPRSLPGGDNPTAIPRGGHHLCSLPPGELHLLPPRGDHTRPPSPDGTAHRSFPWRPLFSWWAGDGVSGVDGVDGGSMRRAARLCVNVENCSQLLTRGVTLRSLPSFATAGDLRDTHTLAPIAHISPPLVSRRHSRAAPASPPRTRR